MKFDLHSHTIYSAKTKWAFESIIRPLDLVKTAVKRGLNGIAVTDHDTFKGASECSKLVRQKKLYLEIIPGIEISSHEGHILGLGIEEWDKKEKMSAEEVNDIIRDMGGIAVAAHPFASNPFRKSIGGFVGRFDFDGIEVLNYRTSEGDNRLAFKTAKKLNLGITAGSDAHTLSDIGMVWTFSKNENVIESVLKSKTRVFGEEMPNFKRYTYQINKLIELSRTSLF
ncbi:MAG: PHP domain-containing protein [Candidatus Aenigmarchaeota archaeon]|nr:PHP domain-containing protein [Candidatus Aenigmarchaeota archaeon]